MTDFSPGTFTIGKEDWMLNPKFHDFCDFVGLIDRDSKGTIWKSDRKTRNKLEQIYFWGAWKAKSNDHNKIKEAVYDLKRTVGTNSIGKTLIEELWQKVSFDSLFQDSLKDHSVFESIGKEKRFEEAVDVERPDKLEPAKGKSVKEVKKEDSPPQKEIEIKERPRGQLKKEFIEI